VQTKPPTSLKNVGPSIIMYLWCCISPVMILHSQAIAVAVIGKSPVTIQTLTDAF